MRMSSLSLPQSKRPWQGKWDKEQRGERSEAGEAGGCFISKRGTTAAPLLLPLGTSVTGELGSYRPQGTKQRQVRVYSFLSRGTGCHCWSAVPLDSSVVLGLGREGNRSSVS